jgi:hypothetical protein
MNPTENIAMALFNHLVKAFEQDFDLYMDWSEIDESRRIEWRRTAHVAIGAYDRALSCNDQAIEFVASAMFTDAAKREGWPDDWSQIEEDLRSEYREEASIAISTYQRAIASMRLS